MEKINGKSLFSIVNRERLSRIAALSFFLLYLFGFVTWNYFLGSFSFFEYNLLQTRYISAGFLFSILILAPFLFLLTLSSIFQFINSHIRIFVTAWVLLFLFFFYLFLEIIFPAIPSYLGGGRPDVISLLGTPEQIGYLKNFNIFGAENGDGKLSVQTMKLCSLYQNKEFLVLGVPDIEDVLRGEPVGARRVIVLRQDQILGFEALPPNIVMSFRRVACGPFVWGTNFWNSIISFRQKEN